MLALIIIIFELLRGHLVKVVAKHRVVEVQELAKVCVHQEGPIVSAELAGSLKLHAHHLEILAGGCFTRTHFKVNVFDIDHDKLREALSRTNRREHVLPVFGCRYLVRAHCLHIDNMHTCRYLIDQDKWAYPAQQFHLLRVQQNQIVLANGSQLNKIRVLIKVFCILFVMRNQLLVVLRASHEVVLNELH